MWANGVWAYTNLIYEHTFAYDVWCTNTRLHMTFDLRTHVCIWRLMHEHTFAYDVWCTNTRLHTTLLAKAYDVVSCIRTHARKWEKKCVYMHMHLCVWLHMHRLVLICARRTTNVLANWIHYAHVSCADAWWHGCVSALGHSCIATDTEHRTMARIWSRYQTTNRDRKQLHKQSRLV
jgi:hypothetical protein